MRLKHTARDFTKGLLLFLSIGLALPLATPAVFVSAAPSLSAMPTHGIPGANVTVAGGGFEPSTVVTVFFIGTDLTKLPNPDNNYIKVATVTTDASGGLNVTFATPVTMFGGDHYIYVNSSSSAAVVKWQADEYWREVGTRGGYDVTDRTNFNQTDQFNSRGDGLHAGNGTFAASANFPLLNGIFYGEDMWYYMFCYDSMPLYLRDTSGPAHPDSYVFPALDGSRSPSFRITGSAGAHIIQYFHSYTTTASVFNLVVYIVNDPTSNQLSAIQSMVNSLMANLTTLQSSVASLSSSVTALQSYIDTKTGATNTAVSGVNSAVAALSSTLSSMQSSLGTKVDSATSSLTGGQSAVVTKVDAVSTTATGIQGTVQSANSNIQALQTQVSQLTTLVYLVAGLAIASILLLAFVIIRKR